MSLREFLGQEEKEGHILHVKDEVSKAFEISHLIDSFGNEGPILFFEKVKGSRVKVVANVCGTRKRLCDSLAVGTDEFHRRLLWAWRTPKKPRISREGPVKEVSEDKVELSKIPVLTHFELDAGSYVTSGVIHSKSVDGSVENLSVHRLQILDRNHMAIRLVPRHLYKMWNEAKEAKKDLEIAVAIGVHPAVLLAASSPVPFGVNEYDVANALLNDGLRLVDCENVDACAPADAELVLEGRISATREVPEGPFVDVTGNYDIQRKQPVVEVVGIMHRKDYVYEGLLPSGAEHRLLMGLPRETLIWESVSKVVPRVHAVNLSAGGMGWLHAVIAVEKQLDGDGKNALLAAFAAHPSLKHAVVVDSDVNVFEASEVEWAIATRFQASEDLILIENVRGSTLDSSADQETGLTSKMGLDATRPFTKPKEKFDRARIPLTKHVEKLGRELRTVGRIPAHQLIYEDRKE